MGVIVRGSIPDNKMGPIIAYFAKCREAGLTIDTDDLLSCLLIAALEA